MLETSTAKCAKRQSGQSLEALKIQLRLNSNYRASPRAFIYSPPKLKMPGCEGCSYRSPSRGSWLPRGEVCCYSSGINSSPNCDIFFMALIFEVVLPKLDAHLEIETNSPPITFSRRNPAILAPPNSPGRWVFASRGHCIIRVAKWASLLIQNRT